MIFEAGSVCGLCIATERSPDLQKSIQTKQSHHLQNRNRNQTRVHLILFCFVFFYSHLGSLKKKNGCSSFELSKCGSRGTGRAELIAARRCTWSTSVLVFGKISILPISKLSRLFLQCWFLRGQQWGRIRSAVQVDRLSGFRRVCAPVA